MYEIIFDIVPDASKMILTLEVVQNDLLISLNYNHVSSRQGKLHFYVASVIMNKSFLYVINNAVVSPVRVVHCTKL
jgi:hypothetical protein